MLELVHEIADPLPNHTPGDRKLKFHTVSFPTSSSLPSVPQCVLHSSPEAIFKNPTVSGRNTVLLLPTGSLTGGERQE